MVEAGTQTTTTTTIIVPLVENKKTVDKESNGSILSISKRGERERFDQEAGPSTRELGVEVRELKEEEETTLSLTSSEL